MCYIVLNTIKIMHMRLQFEFFLNCACIKHSDIEFMSHYAYIAYRVFHILCHPKFLEIVYGAHFNLN